MFRMRVCVVSGFSPCSRQATAAACNTGVGACEVGHGSPECRGVCARCALTFPLSADSATAVDDNNNTPIQHSLTIHSFTIVGRLRVDVVVVVVELSPETSPTDKSTFRQHTHTRTHSSIASRCTEATSQQTFFEQPASQQCTTSNVTHAPEGGRCRTRRRRRSPDTLSSSWAGKGRTPTRKSAHPVPLVSCLSCAYGLSRAVTQSPYNKQYNLYLVSGDGDSTQHTHTHTQCKTSALHQRRDCERKEPPQPPYKHITYVCMAASTPTYLHSNGGSVCPLRCSGAHHRM